MMGFTPEGSPNYQFKSLILTLASLHLCINSLLGGLGNIAPQLAEMLALRS